MRICIPVVVIPLCSRPHPLPRPRHAARLSALRCPALIIASSPTNYRRRSQVSSCIITFDIFRLRDFFDEYPNAATILFSCNLFYLSLCCSNRHSSTV